jgi:hypothetical protein
MNGSDSLPGNRFGLTPRSARSDTALPCEVSAPLLDVRDVRLVLPAAIAGACLVHDAEYHLGLGKTAGHVLASCPIRGGLLLVALFTVATALVAFLEVRALAARRRSLAAMAVASGAQAEAGEDVPRQLKRLWSLFGAVFVAQTGLYLLAQQLWPMSTLMRMSGGLMRMPLDGALPLIPVQIVVALFLAAAIWRLERRVARLRSAIAALETLLRTLSDGDRRPVVPHAADHPLKAQAGLLGFSRPPPLPQW